MRDVDPANSADYMQVRNMIIAIACDKMLEIRRGAENGLVWEFEDEDLLLGSELVDRGAAGVTPLLDQRAQAMGSAIEGLAQLISALEDGSYQIRYLSSEPLSDLVAHISDLRRQWGLPEAAPLGWERTHNLGLISWSASGFLNYVPSSPGSTSALPASGIPWWVPTQPEACNTEQETQEETTIPVHNTPFWVHIPDINNPGRADRLDRDYPRSNTVLETPPTGTTRLTGLGDSFPLMREGDLYFYRLNGRRINLPDLQRQFPQLAE